MRIRELAEGDLDAYVDVTNRAFPEYQWTAEIVRHEDATWTDPRFFKARYVIEDERGTIVGAADVHHQRGAFDPRRYHAEVIVDPDHRSRGHGTALLEFVCRTAGARGGMLLIGSTKESMTESVAFLRKRGCVERQRSWESRLDVASFDFAKFAGVDEGNRSQGIRITTLAEEMERDGERAVRKAHELAELCHHDIPSVDPPTEGGLELFRSSLEGPQALNDAYFLAVRDGDYVGMSRLFRDVVHEANLYQGLTGVHSRWRGRGIAIALKLRTVAYARAHEKREIRTWNDTRNGPMLRINEALGFVKQPFWIEFQKSL